MKSSGSLAQPNRRLRGSRAMAFFASRARPRVRPLRLRSSTSSVGIAGPRTALLRLRRVSQEETEKTQDGLCTSRLRATCPGRGLLPPATSRRPCSYLFGSIIRNYGRVGLAVLGKGAGRPPKQFPKQVWVVYPGCITKNALQGEVHGRVGATAPPGLRRGRVRPQKATIFLPPPPYQTRRVCLMRRRVVQQPFKLRRVRPLDSRIIKGQTWAGCPLGVLKDGGKKHITRASADWRVAAGWLRQCDYRWVYPPSPQYVLAGRPGQSYLYPKEECMECLPQY